GQHAGHLVSVFMPALAASFKDESFRDDQEWRLITLLPFCDDQLLKLADTKCDDQPLKTADTTKYRTSKGRVIPYEEMPLPPAAVKEVLLGFSSPMKLHDDALRMLGRGVNPQLVISRSKVPVR
ncbi:MAG: hypothetical protein WCG85_11550, partial [Polyangia bacterium]